MIWHNGLRCSFRFFEGFLTGRLDFAIDRQLFIQQVCTKIPMTWEEYIVDGLMPWGWASTLVERHGRISPHSILPKEITRLLVNCDVLYPANRLERVKRHKFVAWAEHATAFLWSKFEDVFEDVCGPCNTSIFTLHRTTSTLLFLFSSIFTVTSTKHTHLPPTTSISGIHAKAWIFRVKKLVHAFSCSQGNI